MIWKCSKLIQQKCSVQVSRAGVSLEFLWSCSPVLYRGRVKDTLSSGVAVFTLLPWFALAVWWTGGRLFARLRLADFGSRILALCRRRWETSGPSRTGCRVLAIFFYYICISPLWICRMTPSDLIMLCSLTANQSLMWSQGLMWCPVTLHKHTTFETFRLWLLLFPMCRLAVVCISSAVPLDKVVCFFYQGTEVVMKPILFFFSI